eukprot:5622745-Lingulodinium_polyedra.AAC.1
MCIRDRPWALPTEVAEVEGGEEPGRLLPRRTEGALVQVEAVGAEPAGGPPQRPPVPEPAARG